MNNIKLHMIAIVLVLIGGLNWGLTSLNFNPVELLGKYTSGYVSKFIYILVALGALYLMFNRNTYLPFLGEAAFPCGLLKPSKPENANELVKIYTYPNAKIVYWAAEPGTSDRDYKQAYSLYKNSGVTISDSNGIAKLYIRKPSGYNVPGKSLKSHVHYRVCIRDSMLGRVETIFV